jgi:hypothetical protein
MHKGYSSIQGDQVDGWTQNKKTMTIERLENEIEEDNCAKEIN